MDFGREEGAPARLAIARLLDEDYAGAESEERGEVDRGVGEGEELDIELFGHLAEEVVDAHGSAVGEGKGEVGREDGDAAAAFGARAAFHDAGAGGDHGTLALLPGPPSRAQVDAVQRYAAPEEQRGKIEAQVMALQARVVGQDFVRGEAVGGAAEGAGFAGQHHGREADAVGLEVALEGGPVVGGGDEMAAIGDQGAHFFGHAAAELGVSAAEGDDYGFGAFAEEAEEEVLQALGKGGFRGIRADWPRGRPTRGGVHRVDLVNQRTAQAASGVKATATVTGA